MESGFGGGLDFDDGAGSVVAVIPVISNGGEKVGVVVVIIVVTVMMIVGLIAVVVVVMALMTDCRSKSNGCDSCGCRVGGISCCDGGSDNDGGCDDGG